MIGKGNLFTKAYKEYSIEFHKEDFIPNKNHFRRLIRLFNSESGGKTPLNREVFIIDDEVISIFKHLKK
jgi:hypothetical protein